MLIVTGCPRPERSSSSINKMCRKMAKLNNTITNKEYNTKGENQLWLVEELQKLIVFGESLGFFLGCKTKVLVKFALSLVII